MNSFNQLQVVVEQEIDAYKRIHPVTTLTESIHYLMGVTGKRVRPVLTLMGAELFGGKASDAIHAALAIEVFHNFTLMHDDIMDAAPLRRGKPTVHVKWNTNTAILSGDAMLIQAYQLLCKCPEEKLSSLMHLFNESAFGVCAGQQMDMDFEKRSDVSVEEYIEMIRLKTAVLLGCALDLGACIAGATESQMVHLREFGECLGISFQLRDDYLDAFGDPSVFGKQVGGDIIADKKTYLLIRAFEKATIEQRSILNQYSGSTSDSTVKVEAIRTVMSELAVDQEILALSSSYYSRAIAHLEALELPAERTEPLRRLADYLLERQS